MGCVQLYILRVGYSHRLTVLSHDGLLYGMEKIVHIGVGLRVARSVGMGNARASVLGMSGSEGFHALFVCIRTDSNYQQGLPGNPDEKMVAGENAGVF